MSGRWDKALQFIRDSKLEFQKRIWKSTTTVYMGRVFLVSRRVWVSESQLDRNVSEYLILFIFFSFLFTFVNINKPKCQYLISRCINTLTHTHAGEQNFKTSLLPNRNLTTWTKFWQQSLFCLRLIDIWLNFNVDACWNDDKCQCSNLWNLPQNTKVNRTTNFNDRKSLRRVLFSFFWCCVQHENDK